MVRIENKFVEFTKNNQLLVNGESHTLNVPIIARDSIFSSPLRTLSENFGYNVECDKDFKIILINK